MTLLAAARLLVGRDASRMHGQCCGLKNVCRFQRALASGSPRTQWLLVYFLSFQAQPRTSACRCQGSGGQAGAGHLRRHGFNLSSTAAQGPGAHSRPCQWATPGCQESAAGLPGSPPASPPPQVQHEGPCTAKVLPGHYSMHAAGLPGSQLLFLLHRCSLNVQCAAKVLSKIHTPLQ